MVSFEEYVGMRRIVYVSYIDPNKARRLNGNWCNIFRDTVAVNFFDKTGFMVIKQKVEIDEKSNSCRTIYIPLDNIALIETFDSEEVFEATYPQLPKLEKGTE
jgi:hypothetical protein